jgi:polyferredoxin
MRTPLKMDVIRDRGIIAREVDNGVIENVYRLQITNAGELAQRYRITVSGIAGIALTNLDEVELQGTESRAVPVTVRVAQGKGAQGSNKVTFTLTAVGDSSLRVTEKASFFVPR